MNHTLVNNKLIRITFDCYDGTKFATIVHNGSKNIWCNPLIKNTSKDVKVHLWHGEYNVYAEIYMEDDNHEIYQCFVTSIELQDVNQLKRDVLTDSNFQKIIKFHEINNYQIVEYLKDNKKQFAAFLFGKLVTKVENTFEDALVKAIEMFKEFKNSIG